MAEMVAAQKNQIERQQAPQETTAAIERAYERLFPATVRDEVLAARDRVAYGHLFNAADATASYTLDPRHVRDALAAFDALERSGGATDKQLSTIRELMVKARMFESHGRVVVPRLQDESHGQTPTELIVESGRLIRRSIPMKGPQIIVVAHSNCRFSAAAMRDIQADPALADLFAREAHWLVPQEAPVDLDALGDVSRPGFRYTLAYKRSEFPMIDSWATPTFYFLDGTNVVQKVVGWPREGRKSEVLEAARAIELLAP